MEQMINIINENLKSVVEGIKNHKISSQNDLDKVITEMDEKLNIVKQYKVEVDESKDNIVKLEDAIKSLENDLKDLYDKFGSKGFDEIIDAGNKMINSKIIEKRSLINIESSKIEKLTDNAMKLREDLLLLKEKKAVCDKNLEIASSLEDFYTSRINNIIDYSETNTVEIFNANNKNEKDYADLENANIENNVDGSIFETIDDYSDSDFDDDDILTDTNYEIEENKESITSVLDKVIEEAKGLLDKSNDLENQTKEYISQYKKDDLDSDIKYTFEKIDDNKEFDDLVNNDNADKTYEKENVNNPYNLENLLDENKPDVIVSKEIPEEDENDDKTEIFPIINPDDITFDSVPEALEEDDKIEEVNENDIQDLDDKEEVQELEENVEKSNKEEIEETNNIFNDSSNEEIDKSNDNNLEDDIQLEDNLSTDIDNISENNNYLDEILNEETRLEDNKEKDDDFDENIFSKEIEEAQNVINLDSYKDVLTKHNITGDIINKDFADQIDVDKFDYILSLLKRNGISSDNIKNVINVLPKIDENKLEKLIMKKRDTRLTDLLFNSSENIEKIDLKDKLELTDNEDTKLRKNISEKDYKELGMFINIVLKNIESLKKYNISNLKDCIITHPMRLLDTPDSFEEMLNKYDEADLKRCIEKNPAVLDKL